MKSFVPAVAALSSLAAAQDLCGQYDTLASGNYLFANNAWGEDSGTGSQCTHVTNPSGGAFTVDWQWSGGDNSVKTYPNVGLDITPKIVSSIGSLPTSVQWDYTGDGLRADVSYDLFTSADQGHVTYSGDYELMIWLAMLGGVQPIGSSTGTVTVGGSSWDLWSGYNGAMHTYSFVASGTTNSWNGDIMNFFDYLATNEGFPADSQYLLTLEFGTEPFTSTDAAVFTVDSFSASSN